MFEQKRFLQLIVIGVVGLFLRRAFHSETPHALTEQARTHAAALATADDTPVRPMGWVSRSFTGSPHKTIAGLTGNVASAKAAPVITPFALPKAPMAAAAKADEKKKKEKKKKEPTPAQNNLSPGPLPASIITPDPAPAGPGQGGALINGAAAIGTAAQTVTSGFVGSAAGSAQLTAAEVVAQLFPNGFTQDGMTKLLALKNQNKITAAVYYEVISEAAASTSPQVQALAVTALEAVPGAEAFLLLAGMNEKSPAGTVSSQLTTALAQYQSAQLVQYLTSSIESSDAAIRYQALLELNAGAQAALNTITTTSTGSTSATSSVQNYVAYASLLQQLINTETNAQDKQEETATLASLNKLMGTAVAEQAFAER